MQTVRWFNVAGIVIGALAANLINWGIAAVNAMVIAAVCYFIGVLLDRAVKNKSGEEKR